jgi:hypothetical protein
VSLPTIRLRVLPMSARGVFGEFSAHGKRAYRPSNSGAEPLLLLGERRERQR